MLKVTPSPISASGASWVGNVCICTKKWYKCHWSFFNNWSLTNKELEKLSSTSADMYKHVEKLITSADMYRNRVQRTRFPCMETEFNELGFYVGKLSSTNSVSIQGNWVHWTRFLYMETEFVELDFHVFSTSVSPKSSPLNSNCYKRN